MGTKDIRDRVKHRIVEESGYRALVRSDIGGVAIEDLSHLENARSGTVLSPKVLGDFGDGVDANTVKTVLGYDAFDPVLEILANITVALVQVWKISEAAVLNLALVVPIHDLAVTMVMFSFVKRVKLTEVVTDGAGVVGDDVDHDPNALGVCGVDESLEIALGAEVRVYSLPIASPVSMVAAINVVDDWRDPNCVEAHAFDIIKMGNHTLVVTTAVAREIVACASAAVTTGESISEDLVDRTLFPACSVASLDNR